MTTSLTLVRRIDASPEAVFAAFVEPDKIALWWGPDDGPVLSAEVDPRVGGRFHVRFRLASDGSEHGCGGSFEVFDPPRRLAMSWAWDGGDAPDSHVDVRLRAVGNATEVTFTHARLADEAARRSHEDGWNSAFDKLQAKAGALVQKTIRNVLASLAVDDLQAASSWYATLLGEAGASPMPEVREWTFPRGGALQIYEDAQRAGKGSCTVVVDSIDAIVDTLKTMGVDSGQRTSGDRVDTLMVSDPDGNHIAFAHAKDPTLAR